MSNSAMEHLVTILQPVVDFFDSTNRIGFHSTNLLPYKNGMTTSTPIKRKVAIVEL